MVGQSKIWIVSFKLLALVAVVGVLAFMSGTSWKLSSSGETSTELDDSTDVGLTGVQRELVERALPRMGMGMMMSKGSKGKGKGRNKMPKTEAPTPCGGETPSPTKGKGKGMSMSSKGSKGSKGGKGKGSKGYDDEYYEDSEAPTVLCAETPTDAPSNMTAIPTSSPTTSFPTSTPTSTPTTSPTPASCISDCFVAKATNNTGCSDATCEALVIAADPFCGTDTWDSFCAGTACTLCDPQGECGICRSICLSDCFEETADPGCNDSACSAIVGDVDTFCVTVEWDDICAQAACDLCGGAVCSACGGN